MAEESSTETTSTPVLDEAKISELIKANLKESMDSLRQDLSNVSQTPVTPITGPVKEPDFWDDIINPKIDSKVAGSNLQSQATQDKVDFYTSDEWLTGVDNWLTEEDPDKRSSERKDVRDKIEKYFNNLMQAGKPLPRSDILNAVLGEKIKTDKVKFEENIGKRLKKQQDSELEKARRGVDISTTLTDFTPESVHKMSWSDVEKSFGNLTF